MQKLFQVWAIHSRTSKLLAACLLSILLPCIAQPEIMPIPGSQQIAPVFRDSDLVCNCRVQNIEFLDSPIQIDGRPAIHRQEFATVVPHQLFKFDAEPRDTIRVFYEEDIYMGTRVRGSRSNLSDNEIALLFLKRLPNGDYGFAEDLLGATALKYFPVVNGEPGLATVEKALLAATQSPDRHDVIRTLQLLQGMDGLSADTLAKTEPFTKSSDPEIAIPAVGVQMTTKSPQSVQLLAQCLKAVCTETSSLSIISLGSQLGQMNDLSALTTIETLTKSDIVSIKYGAMDAIRKIKSPTSIPFLMKQLDDPNGNVQYAALITMAEIVPKLDAVYAPGMGPFDADPDRYISAWKKWWQTEGQAKYGTAKSTP